MPSKQRVRFSIESPCSKRHKTAMDTAETESSADSSSNDEKWISLDGWKSIAETKRYAIATCPKSSAKCWKNLFRYSLNTYSGAQRVDPQQCLSLLLPSIAHYDDYRGIEDYVAPRVALERRLARKLYIRQVVQTQQAAGDSAAPQQHWASIVGDLDAAAVQYAWQTTKSVDTTENRRWVVPNPLAK